MAQFVLVPGGWHGGWVYQRIATGLREKGHEAYPVTLTGIGERAHAGGAGTNLDTHIEDVCRLLAAEQLDDVVLCAHSYGGMVITGVADRSPQRISGLVYIDAYVPENGQSCWELTSQEYRDVFLAGARADGFSVPPPEGLDPRVTPQPLASFLQRIRLDGNQRRIARQDFIYLSGWPGTPFTELYHRLRQDPRWSVHSLPTGHNVMRRAPEKLLEILLGSVPAVGATETKS